MRALGTAGRRRQRPGTSLAELLVALVLFGIVGGATWHALDRQARLHAGLVVILEARAQHAAAHEAIATLLRAASPPAGDLARLADSSVAFRLAVGSGVACAITPGQVDLAPDSVAAGQLLARMRTGPQAGDTAWLLDDGPSEATGDDRWIPLAIAAVSRAAGRCAGTPFIDPAADATRPSWRLTLAGAGPPSSARPGAPVRLTRPARLALYRGGTGEHWLGYAERHPVTGAWVAIQPVSGPYLPYQPAAPSAGGVAFAARDSSGAPGAWVATPSALAVATRTLTAARVRVDGLAHGRRADSLHSLIALRNAR